MTDERYGDGIIDAEAATETLVVTMTTTTVPDEPPAYNPDGNLSDDVRNSNGPGDEDDVTDGSSEQQPTHTDGDDRDETASPGTDTPKAIDTGETADSADADDERVATPPMAVGAAIPLLTLAAALVASQPYTDA
ncbi:hypothetical protein OB919_12865 [Halobacteria archaeon AArc-curdl1]|uniref:Uncharacterized protein n=1 Tax=Natronosalvus hydrolyticus TaxID=2979988 RepID=A0AAP2Z904_9EURY|nr:hypothetical protein [Halobacteria archaeon AArc-curdl1]